MTLQELYKQYQDQHSSGQINTGGPGEASGVQYTYGDNAPSIGSFLQSKGIGEVSTAGLNFPYTAKQLGVPPEQLAQYLYGPGKFVQAPAYSPNQQDPNDPNYSPSNQAPATYYQADDLAGWQAAHPDRKMQSIPGGSALGAMKDWWNEGGSSIVLGAAGGALFGPAGAAGQAATGAAETAGGLAGFVGEGAAGAGSLGAGLTDAAWGANPITDISQALNLGGENAGILQGSTGTALSNLGSEALAGGVGASNLQNLVNNLPPGPSLPPADAAIEQALNLGGENAGIVQGANTTALSGLGTAAAAGGVGASALSAWDKLFTPSNLLSAGTSILGAGAGIIGSQIAAGAQADASKSANETALAMFNQNRADLAPWRAAGEQALSKLMAGMNPGGELSRRFSATDLAADPVYNSGLQFGLDEGVKGINARALATGNWDSGGTLKGLTKFANDYGSTKANDSYLRFNTDQTSQYNRLAGLSGTGQTAATTTANLGANVANQVGQNTIGAGNAQAAGTVGTVNAITGGLSGFMNNYQQQALLDAIINRRSTVA